MNEKADTERPPVQDQIDNLHREVSLLSAELGFCMRYCRAAALGLGARAAVEVIDSDRAAWRAENGFAADEDTKPSLKLAVAKVE